MTYPDATRRKRHPFVGLIVRAWIDGVRMVVVERARQLRGTGSFVFTVRAHGGPDVNADLAQLSEWDRALALLKGRRREIALDDIRSVWPGDGEAWVEPADYLEWAEARAGAA